MAGWAARAARIVRAVPPAPLLLAAALTLTLALGWLLRARCMDLAPSLYVPPLHCYSDIDLLYENRFFAQDLVPYRDAFSEYPPLTAALQWLGAALSDGQAGFYYATTLLLAPCAFAVAWMLGRFPTTGPRVWLWALSPTLFLYAFLNWDLAAVALCTGGLLAFHRDRPALAGLLLGLGFSAKWYPAVVGLVLAAALLGQDRSLRSPRLARFVGAAAAGALVPHLAALALSPAGLVDAYAFHLRRLPNGDSLRFLASFAAERMGVADIVAFDGLLGAALGLLMPAGVGAAAWLAWRGRLSPVHAALAALLVFVACNKVYSPQYALWLLPFFLVARVPVALVVLFWAADLLAMTQLHNVFPADPADFADTYPRFAAWNALRWATLLAILAWTFRQRALPSGSGNPGAGPATPSSQGG